MTVAQGVDATKGLVANEPVAVSQAVVWALAQVGAFIVGHTHLITAVQWDSATTTLFPIISAAVLGFIAFITRKYVTPVWKRVEGVVNPAPAPVVVNNVAPAPAPAVVDPAPVAPVVVDPTPVAPADPGQPPVAP